MILYNEIDRNAARWIEALAGAGSLPGGRVDTRSISELSAADVAGYRQVHFFAGIGGWPHALCLAGWPEEREVWTGSCPCQPFSAAGKRRGVEDGRHLWPEFHRLIAECRPPVVFGEQVASKAGRLWLAGVRADLEALGYAVGAADLCAAGVGAPHIRQRLFWVADAGRRERQQTGDDAWTRQSNAEWSSATGGLGDAGCSGRRALLRPVGADRGQEVEPAGPGDAWRAAEWLQCLDGKARRIEPGTFPLADGVPARVGRLRGYGNAIVPQVAAEFVRAFLEG